MKEKKPLQGRGSVRGKACVPSVARLRRRIKCAATTSSRSSTQRPGGKIGTPTIGECSRASKATKSFATPATTPKQKKKTENGKLLNKGRVLTHSPEQCEGEWCCVHKPSSHHMRSWDRFYRADKAFLLERLCPKHRVGHPDPDSLAYFMRHGIDWVSMHACCGCCKKPQ